MLHGDPALRLDPTANWAGPARPVWGQAWQVAKTFVVSIQERFDGSEAPAHSRGPDGDHRHEAGSDVSCPPPSLS